MCHSEQRGEKFRLVHFVDSVRFQRHSRYNVGKSPSDGSSWKHDRRFRLVPTVNHAHDVLV